MHKVRISEINYGQNKSKRLVRMGRGHTLDFPHASRAFKVRTLNGKIGVVRRIHSDHISVRLSDGGMARISAGSITPASRRRLGWVIRKPGLRWNQHRRITTPIRSKDRLRKSIILRKSLNNKLSIKRRTPIKLSSIVNKTKKGFTVNTKLMEVGQLYSFRYKNFTYQIKKNSKNALIISEVT